MRLSDKGVVQRGVVAAAAQGKLPVEKTGAQMILRHQKDKRGVCFAGLADGLAQNSSRSKKGSKR
jgi:hypothetical protein